MSNRSALTFVLNRRLQGLRKDREYVFEENANVLNIKVRKLANGLLNSNGGVIFFGVDTKGIVRGVEVSSRKVEDLHRLSVDKTIGSFLPFVPPSKYRLQFHALQGARGKYVIELKVAAGDLGECYEDGLLHMYLVDDSTLIGPLYPQEIKDLALMRYKELTESFKFTTEAAPSRKANKTIPIICISDDELEEGEIVEAPQPPKEQHKKKSASKAPVKNIIKKSSGKSGESKASSPPISTKVSKIVPITYNRDSAFNEVPTDKAVPAKSGRHPPVILNRVMKMFKKR